MTVWIDISNSPHVHLFKGVVKGFEKRGIDNIVTTREYNGIVPLLEELDIPHYVIGKYGGSTRLGKLISSAERELLLAKFLSDKNIEVALYKHSVEGARVSYGLGIKNVSVIDNDRAEIVNRLVFPLTRTLIAPSVIPSGVIVNQGGASSEIVRFEGFVELAHVEGFKENKRVLKELGVQKRKYVVLRPEPKSASYLDRGSELECVVRELEGVYDVVYYPRVDVHFDWEGKYDHIIVPKSVDSFTVMKNAFAVISAGGTMNREAISLGTPAISMYPGDLLSVDKWLVENGVMLHAVKGREVLKSIEWLEENYSVQRRRIKRFVKTLKKPPIVETVERILYS